MKTVLTVAGSDPSGGAGIQADLKTMTALGTYGMSAITAVTAQNTCGVRAVQTIAPALLRAQMEAVFEDIPPDAVKIGMIASAEQVPIIADCLRRYHARHIVLDPVMLATSGAELAGAETVAAMQQHLFPMAEILTPNIPEARVLCGTDITSDADMEQAAQILHRRYGCAVLLKGGHGTHADDVFCHPGGIRWYRRERIPNPNTHGTGCTLSSAVAVWLAKETPPEEAVYYAKEYLTGAIAAMLKLGHGNGPLAHVYPGGNFPREMKGDKYEAI